MPLTFVILPPRPMAAAFRRAVLATAVPIINWKREYNMHFTVVSLKKIGIRGKRNLGGGNRDVRIPRFLLHNINLCSTGVDWSNWTSTLLDWTHDRLHWNCG